jgi:GAF domain-containing protein
LTVLELEPATEAVGEEGSLAMVDLLLSPLARARGSQGLLQAAADAVRSLTGFERVMVYRFDADWPGEVLAESRAADMDSFLGLHFPASDIPAQARALYTLRGERGGKGFGLHRAPAARAGHAGASPIGVARRKTSMKVLVWTCATSRAFPRID